MKKLVGVVFSLAVLLGSLNAKEMSKMRYQGVSPEKATLLQEGSEKKFCKICGMTLPMFYKTNHAAKTEKALKQYCSIHCLMEDKIMNKEDLKSLKVVDNASLKFINVEDAFYVVGSNKPATMAMVSKYAFASKKMLKILLKKMVVK